VHGSCAAGSVCIGRKGSCFRVNRLGVRVSYRRERDARRGTESPVRGSCATGSVCRGVQGLCLRV